MEDMRELFTYVQAHTSDLVTGAEQQVVTWQIATRATNGLLPYWQQRMGFTPGTPRTVAVEGTKAGYWYGLDGADQIVLFRERNTERVLHTELYFYPPEGAWSCRLRSDQQVINVMRYRYADDLLQEHSAYAARGASRQHYSYDEQGQLERCVIDYYDTGTEVWTKGEQWYIFEHTADGTLRSIQRQASNGFSEYVFRPAVKINLKQAVAPLEEALRAGIERFITMHGRPRAVGIYAYPIGGWVSLNFNSQGDVADSGANCPDFECVEEELVEFPDWQSAYGQYPLKLTTHLGKTRTWKTYGDEQFSEPFFELLVDVARRLRTDYMEVEFLVQLLDSKWVTTV